MSERARGFESHPLRHSTRRRLAYRRAGGSLMASHRRETLNAGQFVLSTGKNSRNGTNASTVSVSLKVGHERRKKRSLNAHVLMKTPRPTDPFRIVMDGSTSFEGGRASARTRRDGATEESRAHGRSGDEDRARGAALSPPQTEGARESEVVGAPHRSGCECLRQRLHQSRRHARSDHRVIPAQRFLRAGTGGVGVVARANCRSLTASPRMR